jgi:hypothetical protein
MAARCHHASFNMLPGGRRVRSLRLECPRQRSDRGTDALVLVIEFRCLRAQALRRIQQPAGRDGRPLRRDGILQTMRRSREQQPAMYVRENRLFRRTGLRGRPMRCRNPAHERTTPRIPLRSAQLSRQITAPGNRPSGPPFWLTSAYTIGDGMKKRAMIPWWLQGEEQCPHCHQFYAYEIEVRCHECDGPSCPHCVSHVEAGIVCVACSDSGARMEGSSSG